MLYAISQFEKKWPEDLKKLVQIKERQRKNNNKKKKINFAHFVLPMSLFIILEDRNTNPTKRLTTGPIRNMEKPGP